MSKKITIKREAKNACMALVAKIQVLRFSYIKDAEREAIRENIKLTFSSLDSYGVPFRVQNELIREAEDVKNKDNYLSTIFNKVGIVFE